MYIPPYQLIQHKLDSLGGDQDSARLTAALAVMRCLLQEAVARVPFDEDDYMASNPDVATAIRRGEVSSAHDHYITDGYFEGREGAGSAFDEAWYLKQNSDVALAVKSGHWTSGWQHYREVGMYEWRSPMREAEAAVERWRVMLNPVTSMICEPALLD